MSASSHQQSYSADFNWLQSSEVPGQGQSQVGEHQSTADQPSNRVETSNFSNSNGTVYVNARQYARILKRRQARLILESKRKTAARQQFLHESRHRHACSRPRGPKGRFLTKEELEEIRKKEDESSDGQKTDENCDRQTVGNPGDSQKEHESVATSSNSSAANGA